MFIEKYKKIIFIISFVVFLGLSILFLVENFRFPIRYVICDSSYTDCSVFAKFPNMQACQREVKRGKWLCDESSPEDIRCKIATHTTVASYCKN